MCDLHYRVIMRKSINHCCLVVAFLCACTTLEAQSRQDLEKQRQAIIREIEKTSRALESTRKSKEKNLAQLKTLETQMQARQKLLVNLESEIAMNDNIIHENEAAISSLEDKYKGLKSQYHAMLRNGYFKKMSNSKWMYLLSSVSVNQLMLRWRYMSQFEQFTTQKLEQIQELKGEILLKNEEISKTREKNLAALEESAQNIKALQQEQKEKDALVKKLIKEEEKLKTSLKKRQRERENLNAAIEKIILAELSKTAKATANESNATVSKKVSAETSSFAKMQGALPLPVNSGRITSRFGTHPHPTVPNVEVSNSGVDFTLAGREQVSCVFDGEVVGLISMPGYKNVVIVRHGNYSTVYAKLDEVLVQKGQKVSKGKIIGTAGIGDDGNREMHFELWKDKTKLDPQKWFEK